MNINDFLKVDGFKIKMAEKLYNGIKDGINNASLLTIMDASNTFGRSFGEKRLELIMDQLPDILTSKEPNKHKIEKVSNIKGMAEKTSIAFVEKIPIFIDFLEECNLTYKLDSFKKISEKEYNETNPLFGKTIVMTGFRDKDFIEKLKNIGATLGSNVTKNTFALIVKDLDDKSTKMTDAKKFDIPIMLLNDFSKKYF
jgi:NAD-dependent DNA ligase